MKISIFWVVVTSVLNGRHCDDVDEGGSLAVPTRRTFYIFSFKIFFNGSMFLFDPFIFTIINIKKRPALTVEVSYTTWAHAPLLIFYYWSEYAYFYWLMHIITAVRACQ